MQIRRVAHLPPVVEPLDYKAKRSAMLALAA